MEFWQNLPLKINPVLFQAGSFQIRYYGLMYAAAFLTVYFILAYRIKRETAPVFNTVLLENFLLFEIAGVMAGGRLGYVLFYDLQYYISNPFLIISPFAMENNKLIFTGIAGMSYHGGLIGALAAAAVFCRMKKINFWVLSDFVIPAVPAAYTFGRIGNFLNNELYGRAVSSFPGMYFNTTEGLSLRHPSQLYEAVFEGIVLFFILWSVRNNKTMEKLLLGLYIFGYGLFRFFIEFFRQPDAHLGLIGGLFSMGQILCLIMITAGFGIMVYQVKYRS
ncbi:MAG: prolipoprotein diacylglyceryl transferase [Candidatus Goldbacteria bacterium]|nr:prolipoprotein diacylglyceryl transferase [Candidatus Goldiibacteriota bacterium]